MIELSSDDRFELKGKGIVYTFKFSDVENAIKKLDSGDVLAINGKRCKLIQIEMFMKLMDPPFPGDNVGLLVKELDDE